MEELPQVNIAETVANIAYFDIYESMLICSKRRQLNRLAGLRRRDKATGTLT